MPASMHMFFFWGSPLAHSSIYMSHNKTLCWTMRKVFRDLHKLRVEHEECVLVQGAWHLYIPRIRIVSRKYDTFYHGNY